MSNNVVIGIKKDPDWQEYIMTWQADGKKIESASGYSDNPEDITLTAVAEYKAAKVKGHNVSFSKNQQTQRLLQKYAPTFAG